MDCLLAIVYLEPIQIGVLCFPHVSDVFNPKTKSEFFFYTEDHIPTWHFCLNLFHNLWDNFFVPGPFHLGFNFFLFFLYLRLLARGGTWAGTETGHNFIFLLGGCFFLITSGQVCFLNLNFNLL